MKARLAAGERKELLTMGRKKIDRSDKVIQTFESTKPLKRRLQEQADERGLAVSALIREILERHFEDRSL